MTITFDSKPAGQTITQAITPITRLTITNAPPPVRGGREWDPEVAGPNHETSKPHPQTNEEINMNIRYYLTEMDRAIHAGDDEGARTFAAAVQARVAARRDARLLARLDEFEARLDEIEARLGGGRFWSTPQSPTPPYLNMSAEDGSHE